MSLVNKLLKLFWKGFPGGSVVKNPPVNAGDTGLIPGPASSQTQQTTQPATTQCHNCCWSLHALEPVLSNERSQLKETPAQWESRAPQREESPRSNEDPAQPVPKC